MNRSPDDLRALSGQLTVEIQKLGTLLSEAARAVLSAKATSLSTEALRLESSAGHMQQIESLILSTSDTLDTLAQRSRAKYILEGSLKRSLELCSPEARESVRRLASQRACHWDESRAADEQAFNDALQGK